jgi:hypothetical protein
MTAVLKPYVSPRHSLSRRSIAGVSSTTPSGASLNPRQRSRAQLTALPTVVNRQNVTGQTVRSLPAPSAVPVWLKLLIAAQRSSTVVTFCLVGVTLAIYGWTVYSQQLWSQEYRRLEEYQRQERQITAANEVLKNQIASEAETPSMGLVMPNPSTAIFLQPAPQRPAVAAPAAAPLAPLAPAKPLGY